MVVLRCGFGGCFISILGMSSGNEVLVGGVGASGMSAFGPRATIRELHCWIKENAATTRSDPTTNKAFPGSSQRGRRGLM